MKPLRAAVVGAGHLGRFHAEKYASLHGVELTAVVDVDAGRAAEVAAPSGAEVLTDHRELIERVDLASVVVPTRAHYQVARDLLDAGIHVLVEKPFTASLDEGRDLIDRSAQGGRVLQVGHIERFNPVVQALLERVSQPVFIECQRIAPFKPRGTDVDVVLDLMIHDIDLVLQLVASPVVQIDASGGEVMTGSIDIANARLQFADGCVANLTASRVSGKSERQMRVFQRNAYFSADLGARTLGVHTRDGNGDVTGERFEYEASDALAEEIRAFVASVHRGVPPPVSGVDGLRAMHVADEVMARINGGASRRMETPR